jgi:hypothetical protein
VGGNVAVKACYEQLIASIHFIGIGHITCGLNCFLTAGGAVGSADQVNITITELNRTMRVPFSSHIYLRLHNANFRSVHVLGSMHCFAPPDL